MDPRFQAHVTKSPSLAAVHAMVRTLVERRKLLTEQDVMTFVAAAAGGDQEAGRIALKGLRLLEGSMKRAIRDLPDVESARYVDWLSEFALRRASAGRNPAPDLGRTLLTELRRIAPGAPNAQ